VGVLAITDEVIEIGAFGTDDLGQENVLRRRTAEGAKLESPTMRQRA
jgi:hypothetical protein